MLRNNNSETRKNDVDRIVRLVVEELNKKSEGQQDSSDNSQRQIFVNGKWVR